ncbi:ATP-grasp domain-containing protein [Hyphomicrobium sp. CS1GBMeth3]|uniref:ATP-grasp domain-containing protein n=1 Tax=Hyphomicrobium sp. CS1GBMeth3 TaxID=1892845 RepID=UPI00093179EE|nr:ATP-grasp domain-containing protein [Hyphomicrobium sp. CS1GBMeth3]
MQLHEFQTKQILSDFGLASPDWGVAITPEQAHAIAAGLDASRFVVKAQVPGARRGRLTGAHLVNSPNEAGRTARELLGQTVEIDPARSQSQTIKRVLVEAAISTERSVALHLFVDPSAGGIVLSAKDAIVAGEVGVRRLFLGTGEAVSAEDIAQLSLKLSIPETVVPAFADLVDGLLRAFVALDATRIEVDPLAVLPDGRMLALGARLTVDDNALFRQPTLLALRAEDEIEVKAQHHQLNYMRLDGDIGLAANGAGLGLATLDMVRAAKGQPANFMDIRTTATSLDIAHGFGLILDNPKVRTLLINVHGGGMQPCDTIADGLGIAMRRTGRSLPTVVRLAGNNAAFARTRFENFGCPIIDCPDMWTAAKEAVAAAR